MRVSWRESVNLLECRDFVTWVAGRIWGLNRIGVDFLRQGMKAAFGSHRERLF